MSLAIGQILQNRYRILRLLGQGGMAAVYLAEDTRLGRRCAVKENVPDPAASPQTLAQMRQQFQVEARTLATLDHPNLPKVYDCFSEGGNEYMVMEYVEGEDLASALQRHGGPLPEKPVLIWIDQVLDALEYLHSQQPYPVIHRDVKPGNILLTPQGKVKLVDFGLVKLLDTANPRTASAMKGMGTPQYTPLEQYAGGAGHTDARSDIYSLGATLYHLLSGVAPPDVAQRLLDSSKLVPPRQLNLALSAETEAAVLKAMEIYPGQRYQTARELREALATSRVPVLPTTITCPRCGYVNAAGEIFCQRCARPLQGDQPCPHCGLALPTNTSYCAHCGQTVTAATVLCPQCGQAHAAGEVYCQRCAQPLTGSQACPHCGHAVPQNVRYCPECGSKT